MNKKLGKNKIRFISLFTILFSVFILLNINTINVINATSILLEDWDDYSAGVTSGSNSYMSWVSMDTEYIVNNPTSTFYHSSPNAMRFKAKTGNILYMNMTNNLSFGGMEISCVCPDADDHDLSITLYNTTGILLEIKFDHNAGTSYFSVYNNITDTWTTGLTPSMGGNYKYTFGFTGNYTEGESPQNSICTYYKNSTGVIQAYEEMPVEGITKWNLQTLTQIQWIMSGVTFARYWYIDDINIFPDNFTSLYNESGCMTYDESYFTTGTGMNYYDGYTVPTTTVEFISPEAINGTVRGFELFVPLDVTDEMSNWNLYINGVYQTSATCCYTFGSGYKLQFNDLSQVMDDEYAIVDIYRSIGGAVPLLVYLDLYSLKHWSFIYGGSTTLKATAQYIIYFDYNETIVTDCGYDNDIAFTNIVDDQEISTFKTVFFSATVDNTSSPYKKIVVNKDGTNLSTQNYPMEIKKCSDIYSFTPVETGTYYICLSYNDVNVSDTFHFFNVTSVTTKLYNVFTSPNPSFLGETIEVSTYISDTGDFAVCFFEPSQTAILYEDSKYTNFVTDGFYNFSMSTGDLIGYVYYNLRIFKKVGDIYSPVGDIYVHYFKNLGLQSFLTLSKTEIVTGENITISIGNYELLTRVAIFSNNILIIDNVPYGGYTYPRTFDTNGIFLISLKKYVNDKWVLLDSEQLTVSTPPTGDDGFFGIPIPNLRGTSMGYLIGLIIVFLFIILPMRLQKGLHIKQSLPSFVYIFTGLMGIVTSTVLPFFDVWILAFIIIMSLIYLVAKYLVGSGTTSEE
jgi:hypothetical protein